MTNLTEKIKTFAKKGMIATITAGAIALSACGQEEEKPATGTGHSSNLTQCYGADITFDTAGLVYASQAPDSYGVNHFYLHELADSCETEEYCFLDGRTVKDYVLRRNELIPNFVWNAWRPVMLDGKDPRQFTQEDPLIVGYLPYIPRNIAGWKNDHATYDWRCEQGDDGQTNGLENCLGLNQLDKTFTLNTLRSGKQYLARFLFGANPNDTGNWIEFCNQAVFTYPTPGERVPTPPPAPEQGSGERTPTPPPDSGPGSGERTPQPPSSQ